MGQERRHGGEAQGRNRAPDRGAVLLRPLEGLRGGVPCRQVEADQGRDLHHRGLQLQDKALSGKVQAERTLLFEVREHDCELPKPAVPKTQRPIVYGNLTTPCHCCPLKNQNSFLKLL